ncbi:endonuclease MutS2 [Lachnospiraceae bacterium MD1]|uniref:Endonuclease MutS2 n=1 Tax=Variimorphobacter saccharofermentans TaxID=2755051 RepID=A0A839K4H4_9FIRM|nr:endonuclease MutS2 [Variimorphobacter saccharofermentans]MBB2184500.1 endonuclease MutS2 [Variimorphobacter saccharofermentans]
MNEKALRTLEFHKIIDKLVTLAGTVHGKELCAKLLPNENLATIQQLQKETTDALSRILRRGSVSFNGIHDIRPSIMRLKVGSALGAVELLHISSDLDATLRLKAYGGYTGKDNEEQTEDSLTEYFVNLEPLTPLNNEIKRCIISEEEIADDASPALKTVRRSIRNTNDRIHSELSSILNSSRTLLQEAIITMRNGRYCLPVRAEYKNQFPGMIHDQSSTGSTLFVEPMAIVRLNNELKELSIKEQEEIEKVLADLSNQAAEYAESLEYNFATLSQLDFIFARASLSKLMKGSEPKFNQDGILNIKKGRHPLIDAKKVVPIDIMLGRDFNMLIITGPNTGGKTVSLKTVGLLTLMGQAGLHIPAFDGSELAVFREVFADIGDEQSIEQSLSTFSSHMTNIVKILESADENSLVLFDELGAGTDPTEGAALAMSILSHLHKRRIRTMATTHYSELKVYALSTEGVSNACCEFNVETLRPTYRLLIGIPGKSNAFAISSKLGLPDYIIQDAKDLIGKQEKSFEDLISDLEASRITIEKEQEEISRYKEEIEQLKKNLTRKNESIEANRDRLLKEAKEQAAKILQEAKEYADQSIRRYNKWLQDGGNIKDMEAERSSLRERLSGNDITNTKSKQKSKKSATSAKDLRIGSSVNVISLGLKGTVSTLPNAKGDLFVQMGILRSQVNISDIELIEDEDIVAPGYSKTQSGKIKLSKSASIHPEINLIGKTVDEALPELDKYLDDAYLAHLPQVTVIHGRGTGALKNAIHAHLKKLKYVKTFRVGGFGEGDHGVTIVEFK